MSEAADLAGRRVLVGVTGGIAAFKVCTLVSRLAQAGAEVRVAMTEAAQRFVTPLTFQALSGRPVLTSAWDQHELADPQHIRMAAELDVAIIAPCSMDTLARLASGLTGDAVCLVLSAIDRSRTPVLLAPSMNAVMWAQPSTQRNLSVLRGDGFSVLEPGSGWQACRHVGPGRLPEPETLLAAVQESLSGRG